MRERHIRIARAVLEILFEASFYILVLKIHFPNAHDVKEIDFVLHALNSIIVCLAFRNFIALVSTIVILRVYARVFGVSYDGQVVTAAYVSVWLVVFAARYVFNWVRSIIADWRKPRYSIEVIVREIDEMMEWTRQAQEELDRANELRNEIMEWMRQAQEELDRANGLQNP